MKDLWIGVESIKYINENIGITLQEIDHRDIFNELTTKKKTIKQK